MISVIIPLYNKEKQIANTLQTVLKQTFQDFEIVIVNDGSTDNSVAEVEKVQDSRIRIIHQKNAGVSAARNKGIKAAKYDLIAFLDADDEWKPEYLETQYNLFIKYPDCSVFAVNYEFRDLKGNTTQTKINKLPFNEKDGILSNYFEVASCSNPPICSISLMVKRNAIQRVGGFPIGIKSGEDLLTWARLAVKYKIAYSKKVLAVFVSTDSGTNKSKAELRYDNHDPVLENFLLLYEKYNRNDLKNYIIRWYKIQCVILLEIGYNRIMRKKAIEAIRFGGHKKIFYPIIFLSILPSFVSKQIFKLSRR